jgi:hypothetical protein
MQKKRERNADFMPFSIMEEEGMASAVCIPAGKNKENTADRGTLSLSSGWSKRVFYAIVAR